MHDRLRRMMPTQDGLRENRWLRWLGPALHHPRLWRMKRRSVAVGAGIGVFFAFIIPIAQIPLSAGAAVLLRANVPVAILSTFVNTPLTFGPVYYAAWRVGCAMLGDDSSRQQAPVLIRGTKVAGQTADLVAKPWWERAKENASAVGKPLAVGAIAFAVGFGLLAYGTVLAGWNLRVRLKRQRRVRMRAAAARRVVDA